MADFAPLLEDRLQDALMSTTNRLIFERIGPEIHRLVPGSSERFVRR